VRLMRFMGLSERLEDRRLKLWEPQQAEGRACCIPHLAKNERDAPNFLYVALDRIAGAPFIKVRRR